MRSLPSIPRTLALAAATAALVAMPVATAPALAQGPQQETIIVTFSGPVEVPGATLPAGTYKIRQLDDAQNQNIIQISNEAETKTFATTLTVPVKRLDPKGDVVIRFAETPEGTPPALKGYFYPGTVRGFQFVYPDEQAREIAKRTKTLVLSSDRDDVTAEELRQAKVSVVNERGESMEYAAGAVDWRDDDTWKNPPTVRSGEKMMAEAGKAEGQEMHHHDGMMMSADKQRELVNDTAAIVSSALDEAGATSETVTISREELEKVHSNLEALRGSFSKAKGSSGETD